MSVKQQSYTAHLEISKLVDHPHNLKELFSNSSNKHQYLSVTDVYEKIKKKHHSKEVVTIIVVVIVVVCVLIMAVVGFLGYMYFRMRYMGKLPRPPPNSSDV